MVRTRTASSADQQSDPPVVASRRGRGRGRGRAQPRALAAALAAEPLVEFDEETLAQTVPAGPAQIPEGFIATPVLQDALVRLVGFLESVAQTGAFPMAPTISQAGRGAQTPTTHTLEQPVAAAPPVDGAAMSSEALWRLDRFTKLFPVHFSGAPSEYPQEYLDSCHEVLRNMGILETNGVDFAAFQMTSSAKKLWRDYLLTRPAGSPALTWDQFLHLFLEKFLPITTREERRRQFELLQQGSMTVTQYASRDRDKGLSSVLKTDFKTVFVQNFIFSSIELDLGRYLKKDFNTQSQVCTF
ncbi:uncharacterized protein [Nicotiana tomentosiformis]|uniref:uncharacterized protein n=1 Tax=Nicotiana tomentosiformis TaxID=4098 RepID=UPI00388C4344